MSDLHLPPLADALPQEMLDLSLRGGDMLLLEGFLDPSVVSANRDVSLGDERNE